MKTTLILIAITLLTSCNQNSTEQTTQTPPIQKEEPITQTQTEQTKEFNIKNLQTETWVDGLDTPWGLVFLDESNALVTQRNGDILKITNGQVNKTPYFQASSLEIGEWWLMWIEKDPDFSTNNYLYIMYTYRNSNWQLQNKITRLIHTWETAKEDKTILDNIPWNKYHNWWRIKFWPDKKLYITTWDASTPNNAQSFSNLAWKILRINTDGSIPTDNPFENSRIFSYWHRNPQWLAFEPKTSDLFASSHWPTWDLWLRNRDRVLDYIIPGWNYWRPEVTGNSDKYQNPIIYSNTDSIPPAGMTFWHDKLFITTLKSQKIIIATLEKENNTWKLIKQEDFLKNEYGRFREATLWPDNNLYILTSNQDGRGDEKYGSDKILKITLQ